jgi:hypothetical protein
MTQIQPVVFPLNLGTATALSVSISANVEMTGAKILCDLFDTTVSPSKRIVHELFEITEEQFAVQGNDKEWIKTFAAQQLGVTLIPA